MENQPQNPEFRINPENFHPCAYVMIRIGDAIGSLFACCVFFRAFAVVCCFFSQLAFSIKIISGTLTISMSNDLDPTKKRPSDGPDLGLKSLQRLTAGDKSRCWQGNG